VEEEGNSNEETDEEETEVSINGSGEVNSETRSAGKGSKKGEAIVVVFTVNEENKTVMKAVKTGIQDNNFIEVLEGLETGDKIITAPYSAISRQLKDDMTIEIVPEEDLFKGDKKKKKD
jgi:HlyD family secretion protein